MSYPYQLFVLAFVALAASTVQAANFTVNETADLVDVNPGDGVCEATPAGLDCSLRAAVMEANAAAGPHWIELPAGQFTLTIAGVGNDDASADDLDVHVATTIRGAGIAHTRIDGGAAMRLFHVLGGYLDLEDLTLENGWAGSAAEHSGSGILAESFLGLRRVRMHGHRANAGAAIRAYSTAVEIIDSLFVDNRAEDLGYVNSFGNVLSGADTQVLILRSTLTENGPPVPHDYLNNNIYLQSGGGLTMINTTIAANTGMGISIQNADLMLRNSTLAGN